MHDCEWSWQMGWVPISPFHDISLGSQFLAHGLFSIDGFPSCIHTVFTQSFPWSHAVYKLLVAFPSAEAFPVDCISCLNSSNSPLSLEQGYPECPLYMHMWKAVLSRWGGCIGHGVVFEPNIIIFGQLVVFFSISENWIINVVVWAG